jgi:hypothetical protein
VRAATRTSEPGNRRRAFPQCESESDGGDAMYIGGGVIVLIIVILLLIYLL